MPAITIKNELNSERSEKLTALCPMKVFSMKGK